MNISHLNKKKSLHEMLTHSPLKTSLVTTVQTYYRSIFIRIWNSSTELLSYLHSAINIM